jgi:hypothetical protein
MLALMQGVQYCRAFAQALTARAMLHVGEGKPEDAWQDLLACHRLGRLVARGGTLIEALVGFAINTIASNTDLAFLESGKLTAKQIKVCLGDLQKLPPLPSVADKVDMLDRFMQLEVVQMLASGKDAESLLKTLDALSNGGGIGIIITPRLKKALEGADYDPTFRIVNQWIDEVVAAMRGKDHAARSRKLEQIERKLRSLKGALTDEGEKGLVKRLTTAPGKTLGEILVGLLFPAISKVQAAADRSEQIQENLKIAYALAAYQRDHGNHPKKLEALAPKYLAKVPEDVFSGKGLVYRPSDKGYLLYSVGVNGKDEDGRGPRDSPPGDDLSVRMPLPALPKR